MSRSLRGFAVGLGLVVVAASAASSACATGATDPGIARDSCKIRDCGPSSGDVLDPLDGEGEDTAFPPDDTSSTTDSTPSPDAPDTGIGTDTTPPPPDTGCTPPVGKICGIIPQCGCKSGENCDVTGIDGTTSCVAAGTKGLNAACKALGECSKGLTCIGDLCRPFCASTADCTGATAGACNNVQAKDSTGKTIDVPGLKVCFIACDPLNPSKTCGTAGCGFLSSGETSCVSAGTKTGAGGCSSTTPNACAPGYTCVSPTDCRRWCRVGFPGDCPTGKSCQSFSPPAPTYLGKEYGVCTL